MIGCGQTNSINVESYNSVINGGETNTIFKSSNSIIGNGKENKFQNQIFQH